MAQRLKAPDIARHRLHNQHIARAIFEHPGDVVRWFGAVQAQDYVPALWAVGLRTRSVVEAQVEQAIAERAIVRTWPMRGTLHFVSPNDARWMLQLLTPRVIAATARRYRELELDNAVLARSEKVVVAALQGGNLLTRRALYDALSTAGISTARSRGLHIVSYLAQRRVICFGPRAGKQPTFVLLDDWVPNAKPRHREDALAELAARYFSSHGPALAHDFAWWSGLTIADVRVGLEGASPRLLSQTIDGRTYWFATSHRAAPTQSTGAHLLPAFDEYTVAYRDRDAVLNPANAKRVNAGGGIFRPIVVIDGQVVGTWKRTFKAGSVAVSLTPFARLTKAQWHAVEVAAERYGRFVSMPAVVHVAK